MLTTKHIEKSTRTPLLKNIGIFILYNLLSGVNGNIDNAAHIGGLLSGIAIGYIYFPGLEQRATLKQQQQVISVVTVAVFILTFIILNSLPNNLLTYERKMKSFSNIESMALDAYKTRPNESKETILYNLKDRGIYYWNENINIINELDKINLPDKFRAKNAKLLTYCQLRIKIYELIYKQIDENTTAYADELKEDNDELSKIIDNIKSTN